MERKASLLRCLRSPGSVGLMEAGSSDAKLASLEDPSGSFPAAGLPLGAFRVLDPMQLPHVGHSANELDDIPLARLLWSG